ncbi:MAG: hypothetical protein ACLGHT_06275 [Acidimicrobiia bacterium]
MDIGAVAIVVIVVVALPVAFLMGGAVLSALFGWSLHKEAETVHEGSEYVELNA